MKLILSLVFSFCTFLAFSQKTYQLYDKVARQQTNEGYFLVNQKGKKITKEPFDFIGWSDEKNNTQNTPFVEGLIGFRKGNQWGWLDVKGKVVQSAKFQSLNQFQGGVAIVGLGDGESRNFGLVNRDGTTILKIEFDSIQYLGESIYGALDIAQKWGLYKDDGVQLFFHEFDKIEIFQNQNTIARKGENYGLVNINGSISLPIEHKKITFEDRAYQVTVFPKIEVANLEGEVLQTFFYDSLQPISNSLFQFWVDGKLGLTDLQNEILFFDRYEQIDRLSDENQNYFIVKKERKYGIIDAFGVEILPVIFAQIQDEENGLVKTIGQSGVVDLYNLNGANLTKGIFEEIGNYSNGLYSVKTQNQWGYIKPDLSYLTKEKFEDALDFKFGYASVKKNGLYGVIDTLGHWVIQPVLDTICCLAPNIFFFRDNSEWGTLSIEGIELARGKENANIFKEQYLLLEKEGKYGFVNHLGYKLLEPIFDSLKLVENSHLELYLGDQKMYRKITNIKVVPSMLENYKVFERIGKFSEGKAGFQLQGYWGFIDDLARVRIINRYDSVQYFSNGLAAIQLNNKWGFINHFDQFIIQPKFEKVMPFKGEYAKVYLEGKWGVVRKDGSWLFSNEFDEVIKTQFGNWLVQQSGKWGFFLADASERIYPKYANIKDLGNGKVIVDKSEKLGVDSVNGLSVVYTEYDKLLFNNITKQFVLIDIPNKYHFEFE